MNLRALTDHFAPKRLPGEAALKGDSLHIAELKELFSPLVISRDLHLGRPLVLLAFTNRSGSTHLGQLLASAADLYGFREDLNHQIVRRRVEAEGLPDFTAYLDHIAGLGAKPGAGFGLKASAQQLRLVRLAGIDQAFSATTVIRIRRRDRIAQAVSFWMARETHQWTSRQDARDVRLAYDLHALRRHLASIQSAESALDLVLGLLPYPVFNVEYEALCKHPTEVIGVLRAQLGLPPQTTEPTGWPEKQATKQKSEFVARFRADLAHEWSLDMESATGSHCGAPQDEKDVREQNTGANVQTATSQRISQDGT